MSGLRVRDGKPAPVLTGLSDFGFEFFLELNHIDPAVAINLSINEFSCVQIADIAKRIVAIHDKLVIQINKHNQEILEPVVRANLDTEGSEMPSLLTKAFPKLSSYLASDWTNVFFAIRTSFGSLAFDCLEFYSLVEA